VAHVVKRRIVLAAAGNGSTRAGSVGAGGLDLFVGWHTEARIESRGWQFSDWERNGVEFLTERLCSSAGPTFYVVKTWIGTTAQRLTLVSGGKPIVKGTKISVEPLIDLLAAGWTQQQILDNYPTLWADDVRGCLAYAAEILHGESVFPPEPV